MQQNIFSIDRDTHKLTPNQAREFRRHRSGVTIVHAKKAMQYYKYFILCGGKRPFLHDEKSRIVASVTPEVIRWLEEFAGMKMMQGWGFWPRQETRAFRMRNGRLYTPTIARRIAAKRAARNQPPVEQAVKPVQTQTVQMVTPEEVVVNRYAETPVLFRKVAKRTVVLALLDGGDAKHSTVYHIENGVAVEKKISRAQKYTDDEFHDKGWKMGKLGDDGFEPILLALEQTNRSN